MYLSAKTGFIPYDDYIKQTNPPSMFLEGTLSESVNYYIRKARFNLTFLEAKEDSGLCDEKGECDGVFGMLKRKEIDFALYVQPLNALTQTVLEFATVDDAVRQDAKYLGSQAPPPVSQEIDLIGSFSLFSIDAYFIFLTLTILITLLTYAIENYHLRQKGKKKSRRRHVEQLQFADVFMKFTKLFYRQGAFVTRSMRGKFLVTIYALLSFWAVQYYTNFITTDMVAQKSIKFIETLEDLANSKRFPIFQLGSVLQKSFEHSRELVRQEIWSHRNSKSLVGPSSLEKMTPLIFVDDGVVVLPDSELLFIERLSCIGGKGESYHRSRNSFETALWGRVYALNSSAILRQKLNDITVPGIEMGLEDLWTSRRASITLPHNIDECLSMSMIRARSPLTNFHAFTASKLTRFLYAILVLYIIAFLLIPVAGSGSRKGAHAEAERRSESLQSMSDKVYIYRQSRKR